jgi:glucose dehydrogenase
VWTRDVPHSLLMMERTADGRRVAKTIVPAEHGQPKTFNRRGGQSNIRINPYGRNSM